MRNANYKTAILAGTQIEIGGILFAEFHPQILMPIHPHPDQDFQQAERMGYEVVTPKLWAFTTAKMRYAKDIINAKIAATEIVAVRLVQDVTLKVVEAKYIKLPLRCYAAKAMRLGNIAACFRTEREARIFAAKILAQPEL